MLIWWRNLERNVASVGGAFDRFAPGWRAAVGLDASQSEIRRLVFEYWRDQIANRQGPLTLISISSSVGLLRGCRALYHVPRTHSRPSRMPTDTV
jgi:hypothetical protein